MNNYEQLMEEASQGNKKAFKELYSYAGSGNAEAQYYLALYYKGVGQGSDYAYWMNKAKNNDFEMAQNVVIPETIVEATEEKQEEGSNNALKKLLMMFSFSGRINRTEYIISFIGAIIFIFAVANVEDDIVRRILQLVADVFIYSQCVRRLHDFGASGWYVLIPIVSWIYAAFPKGDKGENEYGEEPKQ
jgi:uncharacterized membrane protein YhaH (DUF805 family)